MKKQFKTGLMILLAGAVAASATAADQVAMEEERQKRRDEIAQSLTEMSRMLTVFDYLSYNMSGPVVVLEGFCTKAVIKGDAEKAVRGLDWVTHVVNEIELLPVEPAANDIRQQTLSILRKAVPQAFPQNHAYIRIKVDQGLNVNLVGWVDPGDQKRLDAAIVGIKSLPLVKDVDNQVLAKKQ